MRKQKNCAEEQNTGTLCMYMLGVRPFVVLSDRACVAIARMKHMEELDKCNRVE